MGRNSLQRLKPLPCHRVFKAHKTGDVAAGASQAVHKAASNGIKDLCEHNRDRSRFLLHGCQCGQTAVHDDLGTKINERGRVAPHQNRVAGSPAILKPNVSALFPPQLTHSSSERGNASLTLHIAFCEVHEDPDPAQATLLGTQRKGPCDRAPDDANKLPAPHGSPRASTASTSYARAGLGPARGAISSRRL